MKQKKLFTMVLTLCLCLSFANAGGFYSPMTGDKNAIMLLVGIMISVVVVVAAGLLWYVHNKNK